ncbi:helix-turn-helix domain-containing protein [Rhizomonospora bruguierae]|uniref:helix-turn-helix domain-containing protein n=1 Tax=Rhizomonospora bruguierae TaxID=1581705 RepID=UPI001BCF8469|nr:helix-turn-helix transcriptional regulator [Micromonospora sp. NBRC 107566]
MSDAGSSVPRRQLGRYLRQAREAAGITFEAAAGQLEVHRTTLYRIEQGKNAVRAMNVANMCRLYGCTDELTQALMSLARETNSRGWWQSYGDAVPTWFELYVGLEAAADTLRHYELNLIPGLLQTPAYVAAVMRTEPGRRPEDVEKAVAMRLERQKLLARYLPSAPELTAIIAEHVLRARLPGQAMAEQLDHLIGVGRAGTAAIRVLPAATGPHLASPAGSFVILGFPARNGNGDREPTTVYCESLTGALYLDKPAEVAAYERAWKSLEALALDERESEKVMQSIRGSGHHE